MSDSSSEEQFVAWARDAAVHFERLSGDTGAAELAALLEPLLAGKRVVCLGEPDHWINEKTAYRSLFLRILCHDRWSHVGEEFGWFDGKLIDRYIESGDESLFGRVGMFEPAAHARADRTDQITGLLRSPPGHPYPIAEYRAHQIRLARLLRSISLARPAGRGRLRYFGFDIDASPGAGYAFVAHLLDAGPPAEPAGVLAAVRKHLALAPGESMAEEAQRLCDAASLVEAHRRELEAGLGLGEADELAYAVETLRDGFEYAALLYPADTWNEVAKAMAMRERIMQRHLERVLRDIPPDGGMVLMAHNAHLAKDSTRIAAPGIGPGGGRDVAVGTWLHRRMPGAVFSVWMLFERGRDSQPLPDLPRDLVSPPDSLNALLARVGDVFALPTHSPDPRAAPLSGRAGVSMLYNHVSRLALADQADLAFFVRNVTPLTED